MMSNCSQNCWIDSNSAMLCFKRLFHVGVWMFAWFVRPLLATILCVWEIWSGSNKRVNIYINWQKKLILLNVIWSGKQFCSQLFHGNNSGLFFNSLSWILIHVANYEFCVASKCWYTCQGISHALKSRTLSNLTCSTCTFTGQNESTVFDW